MHLRREHMRVFGLYVALAFIGSGLAVSVALTSRYLDHYVTANILWRHERLMDGALRMRKAGTPGQAYALLGLAIDDASSRSQRHTAVLAMLDLIIKETDWRSEADRHRMAYDLLLAVADAPHTKAHGLALAHVAFDLAAAVGDPALVTLARGLAPVEPELSARPDRILAAELEALLALDQAGAFLELIDQVVASGTELLPLWLHRLRVAGYWRALEDDAWMGALPADPDVPTVEALIETELQVLRDCGIMDYEVGALTDLARLHVRRGDRQGAIKLLEGIMRIGNSDMARPGALLLDVLNQAGDAQAGDVWRQGMFRIAGMEPIAEADLKRQINKDALSRSRMQVLLDEVDTFIVAPARDRAPDPALLMHAGGMAIQVEDYARAAVYFGLVEVHDGVGRYRIERLLQQARWASLSGHGQRRIQYLQDLIDQYPDPRVEREARFLLVDAYADSDPRDMTDALAVVVGATTRFPDDPRVQSIMIRLAGRFEDMGLYLLAGDFYRRATLLHAYDAGVGDADKTATAMLGHARVLMALGLEAEADKILRSLNSHRQWASVWSESGPLWAFLAVRGGQYREAVRRWRQTCGAPGGAILPHLFGILVPDAPDIEVWSVSGGRPAAGTMPDGLVEALAWGALDQLLAATDYTGVAALIDVLAADAQWRDVLPLDAYRVQVLSHLLAQKEPVGAIDDWLARQPAGGDGGAGTLLATQELRALLKTVQTVAGRVQASPF